MQEEDGEIDEKDHSGSSECLSLTWLMRRLCREANFELANRSKNTMKVGQDSCIWSKTEMM